MEQFMEYYNTLPRKSLVPFLKEKKNIYYLRSKNPLDILEAALIIDYAKKKDSHKSNIFVRFYNENSKTSLPEYIEVEHLASAKVYYFCKINKKTHYAKIIRCILTALNNLYNILRKIVKPLNPHLHISTAVPYPRLLNLALQEGALISSSDEITFFKEDKNKKYRPLEINDVVRLNKMMPNLWKNIHELGNMFYGVIRDWVFFSNIYIPAIIEHMDYHNIQVSHLRSRLGSCRDRSGKRISIDQELSILNKYNNRIKIIVCNSKQNNNVMPYFYNILNYKDKYSDLIIGADLVGEEENGRPLKDNYEILSILKSKNVDLYLHAGEVPNNDKSLDNIKTAIELESKRVGHGIILFQPENKKLLESAREKNIKLEICPISNLKLYKYQQNPIDIINNIDMIMIGSDDDAKLNTNLTKELIYLYCIGLNGDHIDQLLRNTGITNGIGKYKVLFS